MSEKPVAEKVFKKLAENATAIRIARVPPRVKKEFEALAKEEFCDDFGWTLQWLIEQAKYASQLGSIIGQLENIEKRLSALEGNPVTPKVFTTRKMLSGKLIKVPVKGGEESGTR